MPSNGAGNLSNTRESRRTSSRGSRSSRRSSSESGGPSLNITSKIKTKQAKQTAAAAVTESNTHGPWKIGQRVEACDSHGNWYPAKILDIQGFKLLIHFQRWSSRFDEWFDMDSDLVRHIEESKEGDESVVFEANEEVLARWTDSKLYPARIIKLFNDNVSCHVLFYDGYKKKVKLSAIEKLPADYAGDRLPPKPQPKEQFTVVDPINHNEYVCDICKKGFRKESLLTQHKKHYHNIVDKKSSTSAQQQDADHPATSTSTSKDVNNTKDNVRQEVEKLKQPKVNAKVETVNSDEQQPQQQPLNDVTPVEPEVQTTNVDLPLVDGGKKRKSRDARKSARPNSPLPAPKRAKTESGAIPPSTNPYFYYYEPKSAKKSRPSGVVPLPFSVQNAPLIAEAHENDKIDEIVKCTCPLREESGLMVQCELCLAWQHANCMGYISEADVPDDGYFCPFCRNPPKVYSSQRNSYQLNHWLKSSLDPVLLPSYFTPITAEPYSAQAHFNNGSLHHQQMVAKLESDSNAMFGSSVMLNSSSNPSLFDSYFPTDGATSFSNHSTITTTTTAVNHRAISSVSNSSKSSALSIGSFGNLANGGASKMATNEFDLPPSSGLFPPTFMDEDETKVDKKDFMLHDFSSHHGNNGVDLDEDLGLMDINLKHDDFFGETKFMDDDEAFASQVKATNALSSALLDIMKNLHSLNYRITHHKDVAAIQILEKQEKLKENLSIIESKLEKIEKEIEQKDSYAIHTSSSTLTATSPENFGFSDINCGLNLNSSFATSQTTTTTHKTFPASIFETAQSSSNDDPLGLSAAPSGSLESQTLSSLTNLPPLPSPKSSLDSSSFTPAALLLPPSSSSTLTHLNESSIASSTAFKVESPQLSQPQSSKLSLSFPPPSPPSTRPQPLSLARLFIPPGNYSNSNDEQQQELLRQNQRPSMAHDYLPTTMSDANLKLELAYHYKDLNIARDIVLSLK